MMLLIPNEGNLVRDWVFWVWVKEVIVTDPFLLLGSRELFSLQQ